MKQPIIPTQGGVDMRLAGHFSLVALNALSGEKRLLAEFSNEILDQGFDRLFTVTGGYVFSHAQVGASSQPVEVSQRRLGARLATSTAASVGWDSTSLTSTEQVRIRLTKTFRFGAGEAAGNVAEVGIAWGTGLDDLFCRALVRDESGNPMTLQVGPDEFLDITYTLTVVLPATDRSFTLNTPEGDIDGVLRLAELSRVNNSFLSQGLGLGQLQAPVVSTGGLGSIFDNITGSVSGSSMSASQQPYVPGSFQRDVVLTIPLTGGNLPGGFTALGYRHPYWHGYQMSFSPAVPKTGDKVFTLRVRVELGRG